MNHKDTTLDGLSMSSNGKKQNLRESKINYKDYQGKNAIREEDESDMDDRTGGFNRYEEPRTIEENESYLSSMRESIYN